VMLLMSARGAGGGGGKCKTVTSSSEACDVLETHRAGYDGALSTCHIVHIS